MKTCEKHPGKIIGIGVVCPLCEEYALGLHRGIIETADLVKELKAEIEHLRDNQKTEYNNREEEIAALENRLVELKKEGTDK